LPIGQEPRSSYETIASQLCSNSGSGPNRLRWAGRTKCGKRFSQDSAARKRHSLRTLPRKPLSALRKRVERGF